MTKRDFFIPKMFYRMLIPSVISSFGFALADMADALVVGSRLGETGLAATSLALPVYMLINLFMDGFGIGGSVYFSQKLGEGDTEQARNCFNRTWTAVLAFGLIIAAVINIFPQQCLGLLGTVPSDGEVYTACLDYIRIVALGAPLLMLNVVFANFLRNDNNAKLASVGFLIGNTCDILLNIVFVIFLDLGTKGAALSTVTGSLIAVIIYMPGIIGNKAEVIKIQRFVPNLRQVMRFFRTGFSTSSKHLLQLVFFLVINRLLMEKSGESGVAVFDIVYNVSFFTTYLYEGISEAAQPLVSTFTGENNESDCKYVLHLSKIWALILGFFVTVLIAVFAKGISAFFGISESLISESCAAVRIYCIGFAFAALNIINEKYYQSKDIFLPSFIIVLMREFALLIPCAIILSEFDFPAIWFMYPLTEFMTSVIFALTRRFTVKKTEYDQSRILRIMIDNSQDSIESALSQSRSFCESLGADTKQEFAVTLVIEEICMSIIRNAMKNMPGGKIRITLNALENGDFALNILDNAVEFNPFSFMTKKIKNENDFDIDEIGMTMIKSKTKKFMYRKSSGFNSLSVRI